MKMPDSPKSFVTTMSQICKGFELIRRSVTVPTVRRASSSATSRDKTICSIVQSAAAPDFALLHQLHGAGMASRGD